MRDPEPQASDDSAYRWASRTAQMKPSTIREILKTTESPDVISFAGGLPAQELFPVEEFAAACAEVLKEDRGSAMQYSTTEGYPPLREWVCDHLSQTVNLPCKRNQILITNGSQQGLDLISKVMIDPGDMVLVENPAYLGALQAFGAYEADIVGVSSDSDGIRINEVQRLVGSLHKKPKFLYLIPNFQNPTGLSMSLKRRIEVATFCAQNHIPIIEDDPYGRLRYSGEPTAAIAALPQTKNCLYLGTSSKIMAPGMRVAWMVIQDEPLYEKLIPAKQAADLHTSTFTQRVVWRYASKPGLLSEHMHRLVETYRHRRDTMLSTLKATMPAGCSWTQPEGGLFLWVTVPATVDTVALLKAATQQNVAFVPGAPFWVGGGVRNTMRLNFSNATDEKIVTGITRLAQTLKASL